MIKIRGYVITYTPFDSKSRTHLNHVLFGRILYRKYKNKKYTYYVPGMLDNIPYIRLMNSKIFVRGLENINLEDLRSLGDLMTEECDRDISIESMKTGEEFWYCIAKEKGLNLNVRKKRTGKRT